ncbi:hypothetical protein BCY84_10864 [Trypanosoma cruzi cruzi]|nr:hypothetical protein BCY84_10862 [Trypanosoma cruzi cruzi]PBJ75704.1 hypothetical protein BCY84_10864 [Trypanosoma cruzi cruzi]
MFRVVLGFPKPLPPHQRIMKPPPPQQFGRTARPQTQHGHRGPPTEPCNSHGSAPGEPSHARGLVAALLLRRPLSGAGWGAPPPRARGARSSDGCVSRGQGARFINIRSLRRETRPHQF